MAENHRARRLYAAAALVVLATFLYLWRVPTDPPGFYSDESSICYNAHTISQTGQDEYGTNWPLFFHAFGEYKNPTLIYLLAGVFKVTGPGIAVARLCSAILGLLAGGLLGLLAWRMTRRSLIAVVVAGEAWLTPWLYDCSRVVLEVAVYPAVLALFFLASWRASRKARWTWGDVLALAITLALLTYSYSIGRLLGPLLALGLALLVPARRWRDLVTVWFAYGAFLVPLLIFSQRHPGALTTRFKDLTYLTSDKSFLESLNEFAHRYIADINPWRWLVTGGTDVRDHLQGTGSMLAIVVLLGLAGLILILRYHWRDRWWCFVLYALLASVVPGALTRNEFSQLRLIAFPVLFLVATIPALVRLLPAPESKSHGLKLKWLAFAVAITLVVSQGVFYQWLYHRSAPGSWYVFEARFPRKVLAPALATGRKPLFLIDGPGQSGYIQALWYGVVTGAGPNAFVRLQPGARPSPGGVVISTEEDCQDCQLIARSLNYIVYAVPPYSGLAIKPKRRLDSFRASILTRKLSPVFAAGAKAVIDLLVKNVSSVDWPAVGEVDGRYAVKVTARWRDNAGVILKDHDTSKRLPYDIEPGDTFGLSLESDAPATPGDYSLEFDLIQEGVGFFADNGSEPLRLKVRISPKL